MDTTGSLGSRVRVSEDSGLFSLTRVFSFGYRVAEDEFVFIGSIGLH